MGLGRGWERGMRTTQRWVQWDGMKGTRRERLKLEFWLFLSASFTLLLFFFLESSNDDEVGESHSGAVKVMRILDWLLNERKESRSMQARRSREIESRIDSCR